MSTKLMMPAPEFVQASTALGQPKLAAMLDDGTFRGPIVRHRFTVPGDPMGKPRMTQRDVWKKRPVVLRYREYCDRIRAASGPVPPGAYSIIVEARIAMPKSWSNKKQLLNVGRFCQSRPDWDNIGKSVCDALFEEDSVLGMGIVSKHWCLEGQQQTEVCVLCGYDADHS